jgi:enoyl-CoA hydratase/isomerase-like protein
MEFVLTGDPASGAEFERLGVVNKVFPRDQVVSSAIALAERIALMSGPVVQVAKQAVLTGEWTWVCMEVMGLTRGSRGQSFGGGHGNGEDALLLDLCAAGLQGGAAGIPGQEEARFYPQVSPGRNATKAEKMNSYSLGK